MGSTLLVDIDGGIATLTLNRPEKRNALDANMARELNSVTGELAADDQIRCVVVTGAGGVFQVGGDIEYFRALLDMDEKERDEQFRSVIQEVHDAIVNLRTMPKPVVARIAGAAAGFGISLLCACDLAIAAQDAKFTLAYCHIGTSPDGGSTFALTRAIGMKRATELVLLGERFDATRAETIGLINRVVPVEELDATVETLVGHLANGPTLAYGKAKVLLNASWDNNLTQHLEAELCSFAECASSEDFAEGVDAFCAKRRARFLGK